MGEGHGRGEIVHEREGVKAATARPFLYIPSFIFLYIPIPLYFIQAMLINAQDTASIIHTQIYAKSI